MGSGLLGFSGWGVWAAEPGPAAVANGLSCPAACGSSQVRDRTHVPCTGRWILSHQTTREVPGLGLKDQISIVGDNGVGISDEGGKSEQLLLDLYSYKGLKISEAFLNVKIHTDSSCCFQEGF